MSKNARSSNLFDRLSKKIKSLVGREFFTYLVFLLIAVVIWYFNALSKDYTTALHFKVKYTGLPENKVLVKAPPDRLELTIDAQGFTLLKYQLGLILYPITLNVSEQTLRSKSFMNTGEYFITTQTVFNKIAEQLSSDIKLKSVSPDTLHFLLSETTGKSVAVKPVLDLYFEKEFLPKGEIKISPESITVAGPHAVIDTMRYVYTRPKTFKKLKDTLRTNLELQAVPLLKYSASEVSVVQAIERHTEATLTVPIEAVNLPEGLTMKTFPGTATVNCLVSIVDYEKLQPNMFRLVADYLTVKNTDEKRVKITLTKSPDYVSDVRFHPMNVEFIVEK